MERGFKKDKTIEKSPFRGIYPFWDNQPEILPIYLSAAERCLMTNLTALAINPYAFGKALSGFKISEVPFTFQLSIDSIHIYIKRIIEEIDSKDLNSIDENLRAELKVILELFDTLISEFYIRDESVKIVNNFRIDSRSGYVRGPSSSILGDIVKMRKRINPKQAMSIDRAIENISKRDIKSTDKDYWGTGHTLEGLMNRLIEFKSSVEDTFLTLEALINFSMPGDDSRARQVLDNLAEVIDESLESLRLVITAFTAVIAGPPLVKSCGDLQTRYYRVTHRSQGVVEIPKISPLEEDDSLPITISRRSFNPQENPIPPKRLWQYLVYMAVRPV